MNNTDLVRFEKDSIELYIDTTTGESFASAKGYSRMSGVDYETVKKRCQRGGLSQAEIPTEQGLRWGTLISEQVICAWLPKDNSEMATKLMQLGVRVFLHELAGYKVASTATEQTRQNLENQFLPERSLKEVKEYLELMESVYGEAYKQRLAPIVLKKFHPDLPVIEPAPAEKASLPVEALLTPTQIAEELGLFYTTGNPNPRKVNEMLEKLGYQTKVGGMWSATPKAKGLCDRKPVSTNSRSQRDQLMWSEQVVTILQEYVLS